MRSAACIFLAVLFVGATAWAENVQVRSDVPFWSESDPSVWPRRFETGESFGTMTMFKPGDWQLIENGACEGSTSACSPWLRLELVGAFHGFFHWQMAEDRDALAAGESKRAFIIPLDSDDSRLAHLYAVQLGMLGGSEYIFVSLTVVGDQPVTRMTVLAPDCGKGNGTAIRQGPPSAWISKYCVVHTRAALVRLARDALNRAPLGRLEWVGELPPEPESH